MIADYPLTPANRLTLARAFRAHPRVDIGIECAVEGQMGRAFVDAPAAPTVFQIEQSGFFCYFAGDAASPAGREMVHALTPYKLLMPSSPGWLEVAQEVHGAKLSRFPRFSFSSASLCVDHLERLFNGSRHRDAIRRIDAASAARLLDAPDPFFEIPDFDSVDDFLQRGIGYCLLENDTAVGAAYSSLVCSTAIEVSLFVIPERRGRGVATALASALARWCLENGVAPHWDAANRESCHLAEKLGYESAGTYTAYFLGE